MSGMTLDILGDSRDAQKAVKDVSAALDEMADSLDDVVADSDKGTERVERDFRELARAAEKAGKDARHGLADNIKKGAKEASGAVQEARQEFLQNASETLSSFKGDISDIGGAIQGTLGGLVIGLSGKLPAAAAVAAGATGVGLITAAIVNLQAETEKFRENASKAFQSMVQEGVEAFHTIQRDARLAELFDPNGDLHDEAQKAADTLGLPFETVARAMAGYEEDLGAVDKAWGELKAQVRGASGATVEATNATIDGLEKVINPIYDQVRAYELAETRYGQYMDSVVRDTDKGTHQVRASLDTLQEDVKIPVKLDTSALDKRIDDLKKHKITIRADLVDRYGRELP